MKKHFTIVVAVAALLSAGAVARNRAATIAERDVTDRWAASVRGDSGDVSRAAITAYGELAGRLARADDGAMVRMTGAEARLSAPVSVPWSEDFTDAAAATEAFTIIDANGDERTWSIAGGIAHSFYHLDNAADDWLITPGLMLEAGHTYRLKFDAHCSPNWPERMEVMAGDAPEVGAMTRMLVEPVEVAWSDSDDRRHISMDFTAETSGPLYIGIHVISEPNRNKLNIDDMSLVDVADIAPEPVYVTYFAEDFTSPDAAAARMGVFDGNGDGKTWIFESGTAMYDYSRDDAADDWLITPAVTLSAGQTYLLKVEMYSRSTGFAETMTVACGNAQNPGAMTQTLWGPAEMTWDVRSPQRFVEIPLTPEASGPVCVGFHITSPANKWNAYIADIRIVQEVTDAPAGPVTDVTVTPDISGALEAVVSFRAPENDATGMPLTSLDRVEVCRNGTLVKTFTPVAPGAVCSFIDVVPAAGEYRYDITAYSGTDPGDAVTTSAYVGPQVTEAPTGITMAESASEPGMVTIGWTAPALDIKGNPVNPANVTYTILEFLGDTFATVAEGLTATSHTFRAVPEGEQEFKTYVVTAVTARGMSYPAVTETMPLGTPYAMPVKMSFTDADLAACCIATYTAHAGCDWKILLDNSGLISLDRDDASMTFTGENAGDKGELWLGKIAVPADCVNPVLSYWVYKVDTDDDNFCGAYVAVDGRELMLETPSMAELEHVGWNHVIAPLPADVLGKTVNVVLCAELSTYTVVSVDNISVFPMLAHDLAVTSFTVPSPVSPGIAAEGAFVVENLGVNAVEADGYTIRLTRNGMPVKDFDAPALRSGAQARFTFDETFSVCDDEDQTYRVEVVCDGDLDGANNAREADLRVLLPEYPVPTSLTGKADGSMLTLTWEAPDLTQGEPETVTEGFEESESFTSRVEGWTFVDEDGHDTGDFVEHPVPGLGEGVKSSFFVFDIPGMFDGAEMWYTAHSGDKFLASFFITDDDVEKSDWAISPMLSGNAQTISFWAKSYSTYRAESIEVLASATDTGLSSFTPVADASGATRIDAVPGSWTRYDYALPEGTRYFAIRSCGKKTFVLKIDDVTFEKAPLGATLTLAGYNVYRNAVRLNTQPIAAQTYIDTETTANPGARYHVTAVYDRGESRVSAPYTAPSALDAVATPAATVRGLDGRITVTGAGTHAVTIHTLDGRLIVSFPAPFPTSTGTPTSPVSSPGTLSVDVAPGIYLVTVGSTTHKVAVR